MGGFFISPKGLRSFAEIKRTIFGGSFCMRCFLFSMRTQPFVVWLLGTRLPATRRGTLLTVVFFNRADDLLPIVCPFGLICLVEISAE